jgi:LacI family gluconate utilization system Gnt-I transcriptional repressor
MTQKRKANIGKKARGGQQVRMGDVARAAGVSSITVSRTLLTPEKVAAETRRRVEAAIRRLRYVPNLAAGTLASSRSRIAAVIVPNIANSVFAETLQGMSEILRKAGYQLLIGNSGYSLAEEESLVMTFLARRPDAIVLTGYTHTQHAVQMIRAARIPVIEMWNLTKRPLDTIVGFSNYEAARAMTLYLGKAGYRDALAELGLALDTNAMLSVPFEYEAGADALVELLRRRPDVDAVFAAGDILAIGVLLECIRRGWRVPKRLAVAGFDDAKLSNRIVPPLTTVRVPRYEIGRTVGQVLLQRLAGLKTPGPVVDLGFEIIERDSV